jgi:hypothetical protein
VLISDIIRSGTLFVFSEKILCIIVKMHKSNGPHWNRYHPSQKNDENADNRKIIPEVLNCWKIMVNISEPATGMRK